MGDQAALTIVRYVANSEVHNSVTQLQKVGDAVGLQNRKWYIAIVNNNTEKQCAKYLEKLGYECYVPTQQETRLWRNGVRNVIERVVIPARIFVLATDKERLDHIAKQSYIKSFAVDHCKKTVYGKHPAAIVPDNQLQRLKFILGNADTPVEFEEVILTLGDRVRVRRGGLLGMEGNIIKIDDNAAYFIVQIDCLGVAKVHIKQEDLEFQPS